jgi:hypothetical protein
MRRRMTDRSVFFSPPDGPMEAITCSANRSMAIFLSKFSLKDMAIPFFGNDDLPLSKAGPHVKMDTQVVA